MPPNFVLLDASPPDIARLSGGHGAGPRGRRTPLPGRTHRSRSPRNCGPTCWPIRARITKRRSESKSIKRVLEKSPATGKFFYLLTLFASKWYKCGRHSIGADHCRRVALRDGTIGVRSIMPRRGNSLFNRNDLRRAIRSAQEMGLSVDSFEIGKDGKIVIHTRKGEAATERNSWDDVVTNVEDPKRTS
jgi:hypothetical protein